MKLDLNQFPTIKNLAEDVREKALEYAATLGARGPRPTTVLGTAVTLAKEWKSGRLPARPVSAPFLVQPRQGRWVIKRSTEAEPSHTFSKKDDAVRRAQELARAAGAACFVFGPGGTLVERYEARALAQLALVPEPTPEPVVELAPALDLVPAPAPAVDLAPEPALDLAPALEAVVAPEPTLELAPAPEAVITPEPALEPAPIVEDDDLPTDNPSGDDPIRVKKLAGKWALILGDGRTEIFPAKNKAINRAKVLAKKLGRAVVVA